METKRGFILAPWCEKEKCEEKIKEETKATTRCKPMKIQNPKSKIQNLSVFIVGKRLKDFGFLLKVING
jgi:hypothetical protein